MYWFIFCILNNLSNILKHIKHNPHMKYPIYGLKGKQHQWKQKTLLHYKLVHYAAESENADPTDCMNFHMLCSLNGKQPGFNCYWWLSLLIQLHLSLCALKIFVLLGKLHCGGFFMRSIALNNLSKVKNKTKNNGQPKYIKMFRLRDFTANQSYNCKKGFNANVYETFYLVMICHTLKFLLWCIVLIF